MTSTSELAGDAAANGLRARAPASAANLGPGLDAVALALELYVEVDVELSDHLRLSSQGEGADLPGDADHLAVRVAREVVGHDRLAIHVRSEIPVARGLGSSAALALATAAAAGADDPLAVAAAFDGHPENAAASAQGGLVVANEMDGDVAATPLALDADLVFLVLVPDRALSTADARHALPEAVPLADATFNLRRLALLLAGLADRRALVPGATADRLHEAARRPLFPEGQALEAAMVAAGARAACTSGAGPSLLAIADRPDGDRLRRAAEALLAHLGVAGRVMLLEADRTGLVVTPR